VTVLGRWARTPKSTTGTAVTNAQAGIGGSKTVTTKSAASTKPAKGKAADSSHTGKP
jgi:hypothetical protein